MSAIKIVIIDDHKMVREGLKQLLEFDGDIEVVAEAGNGEEGLKHIIELLNEYRENYLIGGEHYLWYNIIQLLPSSYNQRATVQLNYEVLANIYKWRENHKLDEWQDFCKWIETLPYSELITGIEVKNDKLVCDDTSAV